MVSGSSRVKVTTVSAGIEIFLLPVKTAACGSRSGAKQTADQGSLTATGKTTDQGTTAATTANKSGGALAFAVGRFLICTGADSVIPNPSDGDSQRPVALEPSLPLGGSHRRRDRGPCLENRNPFHHHRLREHAAEAIAHVALLGTHRLPDADRQGRPAGNNQGRSVPGRTAVIAVAGAGASMSSPMQAEEELPLELLRQELRELEPPGAGPPERLERSGAAAGRGGPLLHPPRNSNRQQGKQCRPSRPPEWTALNNAYLFMILSCEKKCLFRGSERPSLRAVNAGPKCRCESTKRLR